MNIRFARAEAERLVKSFGFDIENTPIRVREIARELGLQVIESDLENGVSGLLISSAPPEGKPAIIVNRSDSKKRKRFTISHEIGHFVLNHEFENSGVHVDKHVYSIPRQASTSGIAPKEIEANQFAASLLMPADFVIEKARELGTPLPDEGIDELAKQFGVSIQAMTIRLNTLRLI